MVRGNEDVKDKLETVKAHWCSIRDYGLSACQFHGPCPPGLFSVVETVVSLIVSSWSFCRQCEMRIAG